MLPGRAELDLLSKQQLLELLLIVAKERDQLLEHKRADAAHEAASPNSSSNLNPQSLYVVRARESITKLSLILSLAHDKS